MFSNIQHDGYPKFSFGPDNPYLTRKSMKNHHLIHSPLKVAQKVEDYAPLLVFQGLLTYPLKIEKKNQKNRKK